MSHIGHFNVCAEILDHQTRHLHFADLHLLVRVSVVATLFFLHFGESVGNRSWQPPLYFLRVPEFSSSLPPSVRTEWRIA